MPSLFPLARLSVARAGGQAWLAWPPAWLVVERDRCVLWLPVLMGAGVLTYFALRQEPPVWAGLALLLPAGIGGALARGGSLMRGGLVALAAYALGLAAAQLATLRAPPLIVLPSHAVTLSG